MDKGRGFRVPIAVVTWTSVSDDVDQLLEKQSGSMRRLRPDQWNCGGVGWLIDAAGHVERKGGTAMARGKSLPQPPFEDGGARREGVTEVTTLAAMLAAHGEKSGFVA